MNEVITAVLAVLAILVPVDVWLFAQLHKSVKDDIADIKEDIKNLKKSLVNQMVCQQHTDKLNELIRNFNRHDREISRYKYAVVECISIVDKASGKRVIIRDNSGEPDSISEL